MNIFEWCSYVVCVCVVCSSKFGQLSRIQERATLAVVYIQSFPEQLFNSLCKCDILCSAFHQNKGHASPLTESNSNYEINKNSLDWNNQSRSRVLFRFFTHSWLVENFIFNSTMIKVDEDDPIGGKYTCIKVACKHIVIIVFNYKISTLV